MDTQLLVQAALVFHRLEDCSAKRGISVKGGVVADFVASFFTWYFEDFEFGEK